MPDPDWRSRAAFELHGPFAAGTERSVTPQGQDTFRSTEVTHQLSIDGPGSDVVGPELGGHISADFPATTAGLFAAARARR